MDGGGGRLALSNSEFAWRKKNIYCSFEVEFKLNFPVAMGWLTERQELHVRASNDNGVCVSREVWKMEWVCDETLALFKKSMEIPWQYGTKYWWTCTGAGIGIATMRKKVWQNQKSTKHKKREISEISPDYPSCFPQQTNFTGFYVLYYVVLYFLRRFIEGSDDIAVDFYFCSEL